MRTVLLLIGLVFATAQSSAQELEPRAYSPSPTGTQFVVLGLAESTGGVAVDPALPVDNIDATLDSIIAGYGRTFGLFGRSASAALVLPYVSAEVTGDVMDESRRVTRYGFADLRMRFAMGLLGSPALSPAEFAKRTPRPALGASLVVVAPTGQYYSDKLINLGSNRWAFKPEIGVTMPLGRWWFELSSGVWLFTDNDDFFGGQVREQSELMTVQGHVSYTFRPRLWIATSYTYYTGGRTTVDGDRKVDWLDNSRLGVTLSVPIGQRQSIKFSYSDGAVTRIGSSFQTIAVAWQMAWFN